MTPAAPPTAQVGIDAPNAMRAIGFETVAPFTVAVNVPLFVSVKLTVADPTGVRTTLAASNFARLNAGPLVRYSVPDHEFAPVLAPSDITSKEAPTAARTRST